MREKDLKKRALQLLESYCSSQGERCQVTPQQLEVQADRAAALTIGLDAPGMMLLDDPVGTGKTPVALCVAKLLYEQKEIDYALVVVPSCRVAKIWYARAKLLGLVPENERRAAGTKRWRSERLVVATQRTVPGGIYERQDPSRTLVIVDEAHRGLSNDETEAFQALAPLAQGTRVLLVTATPLQISPVGFLNMLTIGLEGSRKKNLIVPVEAYAKKVKKLLQLWHSDLDTNGTEEEARVLRPAFERALAPHRLPPYPHYDENNIPKLHHNLIKVSDAGAWLRAYHVAQIVPELLGNGKGDMFHRRLVSCGEAFWKGHAGGQLQKRAEQHPEVRTLTEQLKRRLGGGLAHPKVKATCDWVVNRVKDRAKPRHVLIFCIFKETQEVLGRELRQLLGEDSVACPDDDVRGVWRVRFQQEPSKTVKPLVLVARDTLSESIDLDGGRPCIVHHDLPWNPARIQQRYGRAIRISTGFQPIKPADVYFPVLEIEVDRRLFETLVHRCELIQRLLPSRHGLRAHAERFPQ